MLAFKIGFRFFASKRRGPLSKFMSFSSTVGIALGVMALIVGLSCMNGFEYELENRVLSIIPNATVNAEDGYFKYADKHIEEIAKNKKIEAVAPAIEVNAIVSDYRDFVPVKAVGLDINRHKDVISIEKFTTAPLSALRENKSDDVVNVMVGSGIAKKLKAKVGDTLVLYTSNSMSNAILKSKTTTKLKVVGLLKVGGILDSFFIFIDINDAKKITKLEGPNAIHIKTANLLKARDEAMGSLQNFNERATLVSWMQSQGKLYNDIMMIRQIMYISMFLVMAVACFNIISNLIMSVSEKRKEIAILMTLGMTRKNIIQAFSFMGLLFGLLGTVIGTILGLLVSIVLTDFTTFLKDNYNIVLLNEEIYFISFIPSKIELVDVLSVVLCALIMSIVAAIYPAIKASKVYPVNEL